MNKSTLAEIRRNTPDDAGIIDRLADARVFFYDGPGVIMPSGRRLTGAEMRVLISEAGYNALDRAGDRNDPESPKHWGKDVNNTITGGEQHGIVIQCGDIRDVQL